MRTKSWLPLVFVLFNSKSLKILLWREIKRYKRRPSVNAKLNLTGNNKNVTTLNNTEKKNYFWLDLALLKICTCIFGILWGHGLSIITEWFQSNSCVPFWKYYVANKISQSFTALIISIRQTFCSKPRQ